MVNGRGIVHIFFVYMLCFCIKLPFKKFKGAGGGRVLEHIYMCIHIYSDCPPMVYCGTTNYTVWLEWIAHFHYNMHI